MTNHKEFTISPPLPFSFEGTVASHGWVELLPNTWNSETRSMQRTERLSSGNMVVLSIYKVKEQEIPAIGVGLESTTALSADEVTEIHSLVWDMLRLDEDLSEFYAICSDRGAPWDKVTTGLGRMLRSPTFFEDVVKTICTTNIQWGGTKGMVKRLVENFGEVYSDDQQKRTFPLPEAIASISFDEFHAKARMGYRSEYVYILAQRVTSGELNLEALKRSSLPTKELKKELLSIKGVGNYAAANLLMLIGRYDELAIDSIFHTYMSERYFNGQQPTDKEACAIYDEWGKWKYLAYWFEIWDYYNNQSANQSEQS